jgi:hypothetical protein
MAKANDQPENGQPSVEKAHEGVKMQERIIDCGQIAKWAAPLDFGFDGVVFGIIGWKFDNRHFDDEQINGIHWQCLNGTPGTLKGEKCTNNLKIFYVNESFAPPSIVLPFRPGNWLRARLSFLDSSDAICLNYFSIIQFKNLKNLFKWSHIVHLQSSLRDLRKKIVAG